MGESIFVFAGTGVERAQIQNGELHGKENGTRPRCLHPDDLLRHRALLGTHGGTVESSSALVRVENLIPVGKHYNMKLKLGYDNQQRRKGRKAKVFRIWRLNSRALQF